MVEQHEPHTAHGRALRAEMSAERWLRKVKAAVARAAVFDGVTSLRKTSRLSWRRALAAVTPEVPWPTFMHWRRKHAGGEGETWERLLDERSPPSTSLDESIEAAARALRQDDRSVTTVVREKP